MVKDLIPGEVKDTKLYQLIISKNNKPKDEIIWPYDYIYYHYYQSESGFVVFVEQYTENKEKKLEKFIIPNELAESFIPLLAQEELLNE